MLYHMLREFVFYICWRSIWLTIEVHCISVYEYLKLEQICRVCLADLKDVDVVHVGGEEEVIEFDQSNLSQPRLASLLGYHCTSTPNTTHTRRSDDT